jgi:hypothetical protein
LHANTSAPFETKNFATSRCPSQDANIKAVWPS